MGDHFAARLPVAFRDAPEFGKVAGNGAWEQAVTFEPGEFLSSEEVLGIPLARDFRFAEVGAEGAWNSVGPFRIDDPAAALAGFEEMWQELTNAAVGRDLEHDKALEFSYANGDGSTHWIALPVSDQHKRLDRGMVAAALVR